MDKNKNPNEYDDEDLLDEEENDEIDDEIDDNSDETNSDEENIDEEENDEDIDDSDEEESEDDEDVDLGDEDDSEKTNKDEKQPENNAELEEEKRRYAKLEKAAKTALKKLGINCDDIIDGLDTAAAEADGVSLEDYRKQKTTSEELEEAKELLKQQRLSKLMADDYAEITKKFDVEFKSLKDMPNFTEFAKMRNLGLTPEQAFIVVNKDFVSKNKENSIKQKTLNDGKQHLKSVVSKNAQDNELEIPKKEYEEYRELFPNLSNKELKKLYNEAIKS